MSEVAASWSVKRRIVALFVLCGLLPVAATIAVSYEHVQDALISQRVAVLRTAASNYATVLVDRLGAAERLARSVVEGASPGRAVASDAMERHFRAAVAIEPRGTRVLFGEPVRVPAAGDVAAADRSLVAGSGRLLVLRDPQSTPGIWMIMDVEGGSRLLGFEIDPAFLWQAHEVLPYATRACVLDAAGQPLDCDRPPPAEFLEAHRRSPAGRPRAELNWEEGGVRYLGGFRDLFLTGRFGADSWLVIASQPEDHALEPVRNLTAVVVPMVLLGLLVASLLGLVYVRRILQPLNELANAAGRIASGNFEGRIVAARDDEFGVLARSFNSMSTRLGRQFKILLAQAELDAIILSTVDLSRVVAVVLNRIAELVVADRHLMLLADAGSPGSYRMYALGADGQVHGEDASLSLADRERLRQATRGLRLGRDAGQAPAALASIAGANRFVLAFLVGDELAGAFILSYDQDRWPEGEEVSMLWKLGDRVAVALATARRDLELHRRAYYDSLTNLPNRFLGLEELTRAVAAAERQRRALAVLFVDLDGFSDVNDTLGHSAGDAVLLQSASRLRACVRKSDVVVRLGGDEFAVVLPELREAADAALVAGHMTKVLSAAFDLAEGAAHVSASVGIALFPGDGATAEELLKHADLAMYHAKQKGPGNTVFFEASMNEEVRRRTELERELRKALEQHQLEVYYQPQLDLRTGRIVGAEALLRWIHPTRGLVSPAHFIDFAEASGLIDVIGQRVLRVACSQFVAWRAEALPIDYVSVNVSPRQFHATGFSETVSEALQAYGVPAEALHLELTETAVMGEQTAVKANLERLTALGTPLELDDFGTGYSSLAHLRQLPIAAIKLDRAFIRQIHEDANALAVVRAAIDMAHAMGKLVVAEGVELAEHAALLTHMGCDVMQGYHLSAAVTAEQFAALVRQRAAAIPAPLQSVIRS
jgi:diguanylate cyclase (GGDEF)-like protein